MPENGELEVEIDQSLPEVIVEDEQDAGFRWRIYTQVIENPDEILKLESILNEPFDTVFTRNVVAAVITKKSLRGAPENVREFINRYVEGLIPLEESGNSDVEDCVVAIFGHNSVDRLGNKDEQNKYMARAEEIFSSKETPIQTANPDVQVELITDKSDPRIIGQYKTFLNDLAFTSEDIDDFLQDYEYMCVAAVKEENGIKNVVSTGYAQYEPINVRRKGKQIVIKQWEIGAARTKPGYENQGYYQAVSRRILEELASRSADYAYAFSNLESEGVLRAAKKFGRSSIIESVKALDYNPRPAIQHSPVLGTNRDYLFTYLPRNRIASHQPQSI